MAGQRNSYGKRSHSQSDYADNGGGGNKRRNPGEEREQFIIDAEDTVYRYLCPVKKIGSIIGRGGEIVKQLRVDTKSKIRIGETVPGCEERVVTVYSASDETNGFEDGGAYVAPAQDALFRVHERVIAEDLHNDEDADGGIILLGQGKFEAAYKLLDEIEKGGLLCDKYTHTIIIDGLCKAGNITGAQHHLHYMKMMGFHENLVALNCMIDGLCKAGHIDRAMELYKSMETKDSVTYTSLVHNLCRVGRFRCASKLMMKCLKDGKKILRATKRAVVAGLRSSGYTDEAKKLQWKIQVARILR